MYQGHEAEALEAFEEVLRVEPTSHHALTNIGVFLQNEGRTEEAVAAFRRAIAALAADAPARAAEQRPLREGAQTVGALRVQSALILPPIMESRASIDLWRASLEAQIDALLDDAALRFDNPIRRLFQTSHFYLVYHGQNDAVLNTKIAALFRGAVSALTYTAPNLLAPPPAAAGGGSGGRGGAAAVADSAAEGGAAEAPLSRVRVGFVSKFFVKNHPHGQLLEGIIRGLSPGIFEPSIFAIANPREELADWMQALLDGEGEAFGAGAAHVVVVEPTIPALRAAVSAIDGGLDVIVFADLLSEPVRSVRLLSSPSGASRTARRRGTSAQCLRNAHLPPSLFTLLGSR